MRINKYVAGATGMSRRAADAVIAAGRVVVNGQPPQAGQAVQPGDTVTLDGRPVTPPADTHTILFHKPVGYVCSRNGQGSSTIYELLPPGLHRLKPVGRLDKDSSGLLLLTTDGALAHQLTHPRFAKAKQYEVELDAPLAGPDQAAIAAGVQLEDGPSKLELTPLGRGRWRVTMHEGRNRQIRRTFAARGYRVTALHRTHFGPYALGDLPAGQYRPPAL